MAKQIKLPTKKKASPFERAIKKIINTPKVEVEKAIKADKKKK